MVVEEIKRAIATIGYRPDSFDYRIDGDHLVAKYITNAPSKGTLISSAILTSMVNAMQKTRPFNMAIVGNTFELWF